MSVPPALPEPESAAPGAHSRVRWLADGLLLGIAAIWGSTFVVVKDATAGYPVLGFLLARFAVAALALAPFALLPMIRKRAWPKRSDWLWGLGAGLLFCGGYVTQTFALRLIDSGRTGFLTGLYVILVPLLALVVLRYPLTPRLLVATGLALAGMALLGYAPGGDLLGDLLALTCALCFAGQIIVVDRIPGHADGRFIALLQALVVVVVSAALLPVLAEARDCGTALCSALAPFAEALPTSVPPDTLGAAVYTGLLATALALPAQIWAQRIIPPSDAGMIFAMEAPFAVVFGILAFGEIITPVGALGSGLIFAAMLLTTLSRHTKRTVDAVEPLGAEAG